MTANVRNKDDVKAKILLHDFSVNAAVETPPTIHADAGVDAHQQ